MVGVKMNTGRKKKKKEIEKRKEKKEGHEKRKKKKNGTSSKQIKKIRVYVCRAGRNSY